MTPMTMSALAPFLGSAGLVSLPAPPEVLLDCLHAKRVSSAALIHNILVIANVSLLAKWPGPEILFDSMPQAVEPSRLEQQEQHDDQADRHDLQGRELVGEKRRAVLDRVGQRREQRRHEHEERGAVDRACDAAEPADDDHADVLDRDVEREALP